MNRKEIDSEGPKKKKEEKYEKPSLVKYSKNKRITAVCGQSGTNLT